MRASKCQGVHCSEMIYFIGGTRGVCDLSSSGVRLKCAHKQTDHGNDLPVQMKGGDLGVVSFKVGEVEEVWWGLLFPGLPAGAQGELSLSLGVR